MSKVTCCILLLSVSVLQVEAQQRRTGNVTPNSRRQILLDSLAPVPQTQRLHEIPQGQPYIRQELGKGQTRSVFEGIRQGLATENIGLFSQSFGLQVQLNLRGGESGVYSGNQAYYVLGNYIRTRRVAHIEFTTYDESSANPYATGTIGLNTRGSRELAQVYVSLSRAGARWVITQINIY